MKFFSVLLVILGLAAVNCAPSYGGGYGTAPAAAPSYGAPAVAPSYGAPAAAPAPASNPAPAPVYIPAPPCPKNYIFSCQPSLKAAPCSPPGSATAAAAYSQNYPVFAVPPQYIDGYPSV